MASGACLDLTVPSRFDQRGGDCTSVTTTFISTRVCLLAHVLLFNSVIWEEKGTGLEGNPSALSSPQKYGPMWDSSEGGREVPSSGGVSRTPEGETEPPRPYSLHPLPDSSQLLKLVTLHLPFTGTSPRAQVPGTQASP